MKKLINWFLNMLGYEIVRFSDEHPPVFWLSSNFNDLATAYENLFQKEESFSLEGDPLRIKLLSRLRGTPPPEAYFLIQGLTKTRGVPGDVCEFGVAQGETSALIANELRESEKTLHLFDSFRGLPAPSDKDRLKDDIFDLGSMEAYKGTMASPREQVLTRLKTINFPQGRFRIHEGFIEDTLVNSPDLPKEVSFAYVDLDLYKPTLRALQFLDSHSASGALFVVDDYDYFSTGVKQAVTEFLSAHDDYEAKTPDLIFGKFIILLKN
jgi:hypothetical protein